MRARLSLPSAALLLVIAYMASPYVALWRLGAALDRGDIASLERKIDWKSVREALKQDIADGVIGPVQTQMAANALPPFGSSFITGIADTAIERDVSPQTLVDMMHQMRSGDTTATSPFASFAWAFFDSPTSFTVTLKTGDDDDDDGHLRLRMVMRKDGWTLVRAWISQDLIERVGQRT